MPLYEYECDKCGEIFEVMQKFSDQPLAVHEKCGGPVHRLISAPALQFKGSGWYVNDYGKGGEKPTNGAAKKGDSKDGTTKSSSESGGTTAASTPTSDSKSTSTSDKT